MTNACRLIELHHTMRRIRTFEERVGEMFVRQCTAGSMLHLSVGEEGVAGICAEMAEDDSFTAHHRGHGIFLARGGEPHRMFAEIGGRQAGYCAGKGGSMHIADIDLGHLGANAIVGGGTVVPSCLVCVHQQPLRNGHAHRPGFSEHELRGPCRGRWIEGSGS